MKKVLLTALAFSSLTAFAQLETVSYQGAFAPEPTEPWTAGWTNFGPRLTTYPATTVDIVAGDITTSTTWTKGNVYNLKGYVYVDAGAVLTIEPGTIIRSYAKSALVVRRGAKLIAAGTVTEPIVFTSNQPSGSRAAGDWGGVVLCGYGRTNNPTPNAPIEGELNAVYGGQDDNDSSGVLRYVRIEFPGQALTAAANSEINGLTFYGVGRKTIVDHVQVSFSGDDSFEWFGGTVNAKHLVAYRGLDDDFDTDNGYTGTVQFGVAHRDPSLADQSGSNGFESDNDANGTFNLPKTAPLFSNMTIVGPKYSGGATPNANFKRAAHIRRNSACSIINSILIGFTDAGLLVDGRRTVANGVSGLLQFKDNFLANNTTDFKLAATSDTLGVSSSADVTTWALAFNNTVGTTSESAGLKNPFSLSSTVDYRPLATPTALSNAFLAETEQVVVYPNPAVSTVEVVLNNSFSNANVTVQNSIGAIVATQRAFDGAVKLDVSYLANGLYIVSANNGEKSVSKTLLISK